MKFSIIIPTLNEARWLPGTLESCRRAGDAEIIVCDGGSDDTTRLLASQMGCRVLQTPAGRGTQMAQGARLAEGDVLVFLHADSRLTPNCLQQIRDHLDPPDTMAWGCFEQEIESPAAIYRWLERGNAWRARKRGLVYGDQTMWFVRELYQQIGGFDEIPLMEDVVISDRLQHVGKPRILPGPVQIADRHWKRLGVLRTTLRNWYFLQRFRWGVSPEELAQRYRSR